MNTNYDLECPWIMRAVPGGIKMKKGTFTDNDVEEEGIGYRGEDIGEIGIGEKF